MTMLKRTLIAFGESRRALRWALCWDLLCCYLRQSNLRKLMKRLYAIYQRKKDSDTTNPLFQIAPRADIGNGFCAIERRLGEPVNISELRWFGK